jgi:hypothetical protein
MGVCLGPLAWFWLTVYVIVVATTPKRWRIYSVNSILFAAMAVRFAFQGFEASLQQSGAVMALLAVVVNVAIWADNFPEHE